MNKWLFAAVLLAGCSSVPELERAPLVLVIDGGVKMPSDQGARLVRTPDGFIAIGE